MNNTTTQVQPTTFNAYEKKLGKVNHTKKRFRTHKKRSSTNYFKQRSMQVKNSVHTARKLKKKRKKKRDRDKKNAFENGKKGTLQPHKQKKSLILLLKFSRRRVIITKLAFLLNFDLPIKTRLLTAASGKRMDHVYFSLRLFFPTF